MTVVLVVYLTLITLSGFVKRRSFLDRRKSKTIVIQSVYISTKNKQSLFFGSKEYNVRAVPFIHLACWLFSV